LDTKRTPAVERLGDGPLGSPRSRAGVTIVDG